MGCVLHECLGDWSTFVAPLSLPIGLRPDFVSLRYRLRLRKSPRLREGTLAIVLNEKLLDYSCHCNCLVQSDGQWQSKVGRDILFIERNLDFLVLPDLICRINS
jgi:hypothetical protein